MKIIGIDPGLNGAIAVLQNNKVNLNQEEKVAEPCAGAVCTHQSDLSPPRRPK